MSTITMTTIGVIGAGTIGRALAAHAAKAGHRVLISNSRGPGTLAEVAAALGPAVEAVTVAKLPAPTSSCSPSRSWRSRMWPPRLVAGQAGPSWT